MKFKSTTLSIILVLLMVLSTACSGGNKETAKDNKPATEVEQPTATVEPIVLKFGHMSPETSPSQKYALEFKKLIEERTNGKYQIEIFPSGVLGKDRELAEALQYGTLDLGIVTTSPMGNFVPAFQTLDLPFLFNGWEHVFKFMNDPIAEELYKESDSAKIITLGLIARGARSVTNSGEPIKSLEDLKGMKIRVIESPIYVDTFTALGASPQAMSWGEVFTALQQGTIDGQENAINTIYDERVYEVQDNVALTEHIFAFFGVHASESFWNSLSAEDQKIFKDTATELCDSISKEQQQEEETYKQKLIDEGGMEIFEVDREPMKALVQPVYDNFAKNNADKYYKAIDALQ